MKLPKSWNDVTIEQYLKIAKLDVTKLDPIDVKIQLLSIFTGKDESAFVDMELTEFNKLTRELSFLNTLNISDKIRYTFKLDGIKFQANIFVNEITTSEYFDLMSYCRDKETINSNLHNILAIFIKPKKRWFFKSKNIKRSEVAELFYKKLPITIAYPLSVFFCELLKNTTKGLKNYSEQQTKKAIRILKKEIGSQKSGDGL